MGCRLNGLDHPFRNISSRSNDCCYPFENNVHLFKRLRSSVWTAEVMRSNSWDYPFEKNGHPFERNHHLFEGWSYPFENKNRYPFKWLRLSIRKKYSSVWTAKAMRSKKNGHLFELLMLSLWKKLEWFERLMSTVPEKFVVFSFWNSCCASVRSHKTIIAGSANGMSWDSSFQTTENLFSTVAWMIVFV